MLRHALQLEPAGGLECTRLADRTFIAGAPTYITHLATLVVTEAMVAVMGPAITLTMGMVMAAVMEVVTDTVAVMATAAMDRAAATGMEIPLGIVA